VPGVGKTTLAVALGKALGLAYQRIQFTPDVLPSDIVGFSIYDKSTGNFKYMPGTVNRANLLLADEINRTSSKTQSALLEAMEERQVTVDGNVYPLPKPFLVIATENHVGAAGTQLLPHAQLDRFLVRLTIGYPDFEAQMDIIRDRAVANPMDNVAQVADQEQILTMQKEAAAVTMKDEIVAYITRLAIASREHPMVELGISPRGAIAIGRMARACAYVRGRDYVVPEDVQAVFTAVCAHRLLLSQKAKAARLTSGTVLEEILKETKVPYQK
jgi:MoxR-like ATPase